MSIKKGCIARCKAGMLGLVTSDSPQMTRYGTSELIRFLVHNTGPFYHGETK